MYNFCVIYTMQSKKRTLGKSILPYRVRYIGQCDGIKKGVKDIEGRVEDPSRRYLSNNTTTPGGVDASRYLYEP